MELNARAALGARAGALVDMIGHAALEECAHDIATGMPPSIIAERIGRPEDAKLHAKLVLADAEKLLVTSTNLTVSGLEHNIEAGLLVTGGPAPAQTAAHLREMVENGVLERI